ncbi:hypothetical protein J2Z65_002420 [Paenibacillus aceris]|uniref:Uncharacterized protein n=1 Tax=Paenibacillus aceris TaxID=869555 RepID=A0ABS4HZ40_9BACL|nr:hypothetical protein [Paenibacillus aceris]
MYAGKYGMNFEIRKETTTRIAKGLFLSLQDLGQPLFHPHRSFSLEGEWRISIDKHGIGVIGYFQ